MLAAAKAALWQLRKRVMKSPIDLPFHGLTIRCYPDSHDASRVIYFNGLPDPTEMTFAKHYLRPGDNVIDAGANIGVYTLFLSTLIGNGKVTAFEPDRKCVQRLRENVEHNRLTNVVVREAAVGDFRGTALFSAGEDTAGSFANLRKSALTRAVDVVRLDDEIQGPVALCKLDVEGAETAAIRGAEECLSAHNPPVWLVELTRRTLQRSGTSLEDFIQLLARHGYGLWTYDPIDRELIEWTERPRKPGHIGDAIAISNDQLEWVQARLGARVSYVNPK
jgi:FkbM family methyltransferase